MCYVQVYMDACVLHSSMKHSFMYNIANMWESLYRLTPCLDTQLYQSFLYITIFTHSCYNAQVFIYTQLYINTFVKHRRNKNV